MNPHVARLEGVDEKDRRVTADNEAEAAVLRGVQRREGWKRMEKEGFILGRYFEFHGRVVISMQYYGGKKDKGS